MLSEVDSLAFEHPPITMLALIENEIAVRVALATELERRGLSDWTVVVMTDSPVGPGQGSQISTM